jgi:hypothetical protein
MPADRVLAQFGAIPNRILDWFPFAVPAAVLVYLGVMIGADGMALDAAVPLPNYMIAGIKLPVRAYRDGAEALSKANPADGNAQVARAEAELMAGEPQAQVEQRLADGLARAPANARGWTLLSEAANAPADAAQALDVALMLAPYDFYLSGRRVRDAAMIWPRLAPETQRAAQRGAVLLSTDPQLRPQYDALLATDLRQRVQSMVVQSVLIPDLRVSVGR